MNAFFSFLKIRSGQNIMRILGETNQCAIFDTHAVSLLLSKCRSLLLCKTYFAEFCPVLDM